jgi:hypothetical protein
MLAGAFVLFSMYLREEDGDEPMMTVASMSLPKTIGLACLGMA